MKRKIVLQKKREEAERKKKENRREAERAREAASMVEAAARKSAAAALLQLTAVVPDPQKPTTKDAVVQTDLTTSDIQCLEEKASKVGVVERFLLTDDVLKLNDAAVKFYTGLPTYSRLKTVFDLVSGCLEKHGNSSLSVFQEFLLTLMKMCFKFT